MVRLTAAVLWVVTVGLAAPAPLSARAVEERPEAEEIQRPASIDEEMWRRLKRLDERAARIRSFSASFRQEQHTALLKEPIVSRGHLRLKGQAVRWDTQTPQPSSMLVTPSRLLIYYPRQKLLEIHPSDERFPDVVASPTPRLRDLLSSFRMRAEPQPPPEARDGHASQSASILLKLEPREKAAREHIQRVEILLDESRAFAREARITDADGETTVIEFGDVRINVELPDEALELEVPEGTRISRPYRRRAGDGTTR